MTGEMTVYPGQSITLATTFHDVPGGSLTDPTGLQLVIKRGDMVVAGPIAVLSNSDMGVVRDGAGLYHYDWVVPGLAVPDTYTAAWTGQIGGVAASNLDTFEILDSDTAAWATATDVGQITGANVTDSDIARAQAIIDTFCGAGLVQTLTPRDRRFLRLAVAYQTAWMQDNADVFARHDLVNVNQDGTSATARDSASFILAPLSRQALSRCSWSRSRTQRVEPNLRWRRTDFTFFGTDGNDFPRWERI